MIAVTYKDQVALLLAVIPEIAKEKNLALHGGTAINLFVRDMPRLSVDIDLTWIPVEDRQTTMKNLHDALTRIRENLLENITGVNIQPVTMAGPMAGKLQISTRKANVILEVALNGRGVIEPPVMMDLCARAQEEFEAFCAIQVVSMGQLYGGKLCAAMDRQHPRDLFDVSQLLDNEGITADIKRGFIFRLMSTGKPMADVLFPNLIDQKDAMQNQFVGMTVEDFTYEQFEVTRNKMIAALHASLTVEDKQFILDFKAGAPDWRLYDFSQFPGVQYKLNNILVLREDNPEKFKDAYQKLKDHLEAI